MVRRPHRGTMLIVTIIVTFALAGMVLVLCRSMRVESLAAANAAAAMQVASVERGAEQYVLAMIAQEGDEVRDVSENLFSGVQVGDGVFWIVRPQYAGDGDETLPVFGLVEESAKINLNSAPYDAILRLPGISDTAASSIMDWIDVDNTLERDGAESDYYLGLAEPYYCKNGPFETIEELLMVRGVYREMLFGDGTAAPLGSRTGAVSRGGMSGGSLTDDPQLANGFYDLVTVYSSEPNTTADGQARININNNNRAMRRALYARMLTRIEQKRAEQIVVAIGTSDMRDIFEFCERAKLKPEEVDKLADDLTTTSSQTLRGRINVNVAPRAVLETLNGLEDADVDKLISARSSNPTGIGWVWEALGAKGAQSRIGSQITTKTYQYSADIVAATLNGRAFKRVRIVVSTRSGTPQIVYRRDISDRGWPMDRQLLTSLRSGEYAAGMTGGGVGGTSARGGI